MNKLADEKNINNQIKGIRNIKKSLENLKLNNTNIQDNKSHNDEITNLEYHLETNINYVKRLIEKYNIEYNESMTFESMMEEPFDQNGKGIFRKKHTRRHKLLSYKKCKKTKFVKGIFRKKRKTKINKKKKNRYSRKYIIKYK